jgi:hypothetical protein
MDSAHLRQIYISAHENVTGWSLSVRLASHDEEGNYDEGRGLRRVAQLPDFQGDAWMVLAVLDAIAQLVRDEGGVPDSPWFPGTRPESHSKS